jgi:hypothetical protein
VLGFPGGAPDIFIGQGEVLFDISPAAVAGMQTATLFISERESWRGVDETDVRKVGRSSEFFCGVQGILIAVEDVAKLPLCAVVSGEEDDACLLSFLSHEGVRWHGLFCSWAGLATWVATGLRWPLR